MNAIEFQAVAHDGVLDIPPEHRRLLDGKRVRVVLVDAEPRAADSEETIFVRLRRAKTQGPWPVQGPGHGFFIDCNQ